MGQKLAIKEIAFTSFIIPILAPLLLKFIDMDILAFYMSR